MIQQCYIKSEDTYLLACVYIPRKYTNVVILLQGYSHSMTDIDYFMTNIKNELIDNGFAVVQFDPYGHGDSDGSIELFDYKRLIKDINTITDWTILQFGPKPIIITRGLYELALYNNEIVNRYQRCIVLNPVYISEDEYGILKKYISQDKPIIDFYKWYDSVNTQDQEIMESVFYVFGAKLKNLQGQLFNLVIFDDFIKLAMNRKVKVADNSYYIFASSNQKISICNNCNFPTQFSISSYEKYGALPRDPDWHYNIINNIVSLCKDV